MRIPKNAGLWLALVVVAVLNWGPGYTSRNGSGTYTIPNSFSPGQTITSSGMNQNFSDIASELTNSVAADGQTSMTGPLKACSGTVSAPCITFAADTDTGFYRSAANEMSAAAGGTQIAVVSSSGLNVASGQLLQGGAALVPVGSVVAYAGSSAPTGWLLMRGQCVSRATYASLFALLSTTFNSGCSGSEFGIPDAGGRIIAGLEASATRLTASGSGCTGSTLGSTCGAETVTVAQGNLPSYTLPNTLALNSGQITNGTVVWRGGNISSLTSPAGGGTNFIIGATQANLELSSTALSGSVTSGGSGNAVNKQPATIVLGYIIKH